jgi:hypothetical protein
MLTGANFLNLALPKFILSLLPPRDNGLRYALCAMLYAFSVASRRRPVFQPEGLQRRSSGSPEV